ncbi:4-hydroxy-4-methyl-2-oxoglutarate aldolase OS=Castellaniella defragrans OX=75697 GN=HNR28_001887 PE=4 SV=1 [Castellaniella defragrans]
MQLGFRIASDWARPKTTQIEAFGKMPTAIISDNMNRMFAGGATLRPIHRTGFLCGAAFTVRTRPGDNLMVHKALDLAQAGDVIVVDAGGDLTNAIIGEIMCSYARKRGIAGFVIDGAIRDSAALAQGLLPVYASGVTHRGPYKDGPGEIGLPVQVGGMPVSPGDIIIGDEDGVVCVPLQNATEIYEAALSQAAREQSILHDIENDKWDHVWVDKVLLDKGFKQ